MTITNLKARWKHLDDSPAVRTVGNVPDSQGHIQPIEAVFIALELVTEYERRYCCKLICGLIDDGEIFAAYHVVKWLISQCDIEAMTVALEARKK